MPPPFWTSTSGLLICGVFLGAGVLGKRRKQWLLSFVLLFTVGMISCGGGGSTGGGGTTPPPPPPQTSATYHFTLTATGGGNTASQTYTVTVSR